MNINYASFSRRLIAAVLDAVIYGFALTFLTCFLLLPTLLLGFLASFSQITAMLFASSLWIFGSLLIFVSHWLYYAGCEFSIHQATPGKAIMGLKICNYAEERVSFKQATIRYLSHYLSLLSLGIGFFLSLFSARRQSLHDLLAKTLVLHRPQSLATKTQAIA